MMCQKDLVTNLTYIVTYLIGTAVLAAFPGRDFNFTVGTKLHFTDVGTNRSLSNDQVLIPIINDDIAEPRESFICSLQGDNVNSVQVVSPSQITIEIWDDDGTDMHVLQMMLLKFSEQYFY